MERPSIEEVLALDAVSLSDPSGGLLNLTTHRAKLEKSMAMAEFAAVRRANVLVAYGYLWPMEAGNWFVGGFSIHADHRNAVVTAELLQNFSTLVRRLNAVKLHSHVLKSNALSLRFHRRLGFVAVKENDLAVAFTCRVAAVAGTPLLERVISR